MAEHNKQWLMKTKISDIQGLAAKLMQIEYHMISDTVGGSSFLWTPVLNGGGQILSELFRVPFHWFYLFH